MANKIGTTCAEMIRSSGRYRWCAESVAWFGICTYKLETSVYYPSSSASGNAAMFRIDRNKPWPPSIDLGTVRETLAYMHDDMKRVGGLEKVAAALQATLAEIDAAERASRPATIAPIDLARFLPRRR